jgi:hypothetical protein
MRLPPLALYAAALAASFGCSSPVPATPDVAWQVNMSSAGASCNLMISTRSIGDINETSIQQRVTDGMNGAAVSCFVWPNGSGFGVDVRASQGASSLNLFIDKIDDSATKDAPVNGGVSYESDATVALYSGSSCSFYFINPDPSGHGMGVSAGKIWVAFTCDGITNGSASPPSTCPVAQSFAAFENCDTNPPPA